MNTALFAGSFDPFTNGHMDILMQASEMFDKVIVAIANNSEKKNFLSVAKRVQMVKKCISGLKNVEVASYEGLTAEYAKKRGANILVRGVRNTSDFEYEMQISSTNSLLAPEIITILLTPKQENVFISSTIVRDLYQNGKWR